MGALQKGMKPGTFKRLRKLLIKPVNCRIVLAFMPFLKGYKKNPFTFKGLAKGLFK
jgi:hypothetical protein